MAAGLVRGGVRIAASGSRLSKIVGKRPALSLGKAINEADYASRALGKNRKAVDTALRIRGLRGR